MSGKAMTLRLDAEQAAALEAVARTDEMPVSEAVRSAIDAHIEARRGDAEFRQRLAKIIEEDREVLERLREEPPAAEEQAQAAVQRAKAAVLEEAAVLQAPG